LPPTPSFSLFPYTTLFRSSNLEIATLIADGLKEKGSSIRHVLYFDDKSNQLCALELAEKPYKRILIGGTDPNFIFEKIGSSPDRAEEHASELQSPYDLVCR